MSPQERPSSKCRRAAATIIFETHEHPTIVEGGVSVIGTALKFEVVSTIGLIPKVLSRLPNFGRMKSDSGFGKDSPFDIFGRHVRSYRTRE